MHDKSRMSRVTQLVLVLSVTICLSMTGCVRTTLVCQAVGECPPSVYDSSRNDLVASAVSANFGMTLAGLVLLFSYRKTV